MMPLRRIESAIWRRAFGVWAADATPDGRYLLFVSQANVTGYLTRE